MQSALSTSVRNLERELGAELFDRTGRRVRLTEAGRALLPQARQLLAGAASARDAVARVAGLGAGRLAIGTIQTLTCVDLAAEPFVDFRAGTGLETAVRRLAAHCGLERRITCDVTQIGLLVDLVRAGIGVAIVPRRIGEAAGLPCVAIRQPEPGREVLLAGRAPRPRNPAAGALLERLTGAAPEGAGRPAGRRVPAG